LKKLVQICAIEVWRNLEENWRNCSCFWKM